MQKVLCVLIKTCGERITQIAVYAQTHLGLKSKESFKLPEENEAYCIVYMNADRNYKNQWGTSLLRKGRDLFHFSFVSHVIFPKRNLQFCLFLFKTYSSFLPPLNCLAYAYHGPFYMVVCQFHFLHEISYQLSICLLAQIFKTGNLLGLMYLFMPSIIIKHQSPNVLPSVQQKHIRHLLNEFFK